MKRSPVKSAALALKTIPDGAAVAVLFFGGGIVTTNGTFFPLPSYSVDTPALLSETQNGVGPCTKPQGLSRFLSRTFPCRGLPEVTRLVCAYAGVFFFSASCIDGVCAHT